MSVGTALRIVHFAYYTERENNVSGTRSDTLTLDSVPRQNARYPTNGGESFVCVGICLVAPPGEYFLAVRSTRDFPHIHHANAHAHCRPRL